jgi:hypothetical protein
MAIFRYGKRVGGSDVIFGEQGDHALLGALTLEALGLSLDPLKRELKPLPLMLAAVPSNEPGMKSACKIDVGRPPQGRPIFPICSNFRRFETSARILPSD